MPRLSNLPPEVGHRAWADLHRWAGDFRAHVGDACGCGDFAVAGMRAFHDLVNHGLGKSVQYPDNLKRLAAAYQEAASAQKPHNGHVEFSQAFMERVMTIAREQLGFDFPLPPGTKAGPSSAEVSPYPATPVRPLAISPDKPTPAVLKPFPFQAEGIAWLKRRETALLADDMGLGKTVQAIFWAADRKPVLVIVPAAVQYNWADEIKKWRPGDAGSITVLESGDDLPKKLPQWTVITYGMVSRQQRRRHYLFESEQEAKDWIEQDKKIESPPNLLPRQYAIHKWPPAWETVEGTTTWEVDVWTAKPVTQSSIYPWPDGWFDDDDVDDDDLRHRVPRKPKKYQFSQSFLETILHTALGTATSIGVAKALSASVVPGGVQVDDEEKRKKEEEEKRNASASVLSPSFVEGDQAQVELGTLLQEIDAILKKPDTMGIVDATTLRVVRE